MSNIWIGDLEVLTHGVLISPGGQPIYMSYPLSDTDVLNLRFIFVQEDDVVGPDGEKTRPAARVGSSLNLDGHVFEIRLYNFDKPLGQSLLTPMHFADSDLREPITFCCTVYKHAETMKIEYQVMRGARNEPTA